MDGAIDELDDKYRLDAESFYLTGTQALVRLPMMQRERDRAAGLDTAGFISGYRGSPLGDYDNALWRAKSVLQAHDVTFSPGLNEDLAATAVWGSQQVGLFPGAKVDGVFGIWYGKGPGVDRSADALKHANSAGTSRHGGVLALAGDDHGCQSSTLAHQSEQIFAAAMMPVINPASLQDYLDLGLLGFALSRFSGCWVGFKTISETVESSASLRASHAGPEIVIPADFDLPAGGLNIRWPDPPLEQERRLHGAKMRAVAAFARANVLVRVMLDSPGARLGILASGKAYTDLRQALEDLGVDDEAARRLGLRIYKVGLAWPLEEECARRFAEGLRDILVIEEKRGFIEDQLVRILYNTEASRRPSVVGKRDEAGAPLLPSEGELSPTLVAAALLSRLGRLGTRAPELEQRLARLELLERVGASGAVKTQRTPFFCSGCPHNTSTKVPEGSRAMAGIGCHGMALYVPSRRTATITHMGAEGANWIGQAPFTNEPHIFQNMGDGTYTHSGLLALRAAAAAGVNITYKILYTDAVAMTGGQPAEGGLTVGQIAHQVAAEGARRVAVVSDEPEKYPSRGYFPASSTIHHRRDMDVVQRELREIAGLTALIYDQTCAAEKRRRRKRGLYPDPPKRAFINKAVCEGCGDCSVASNCISIQPVETELGRKRRIDQSNCNKDFSCVEGFCPSFVTVRGGTLRRGRSTQAQAIDVDLAEPPILALERPYDILIAGVGGTGVITIGALLAMAAHLEGKGCTTLDFTGLSQKNGAVLSHVRIAPRPEDIAAVRIAPGAADLLLGCDLVVSASGASLSRLQAGSSRALVNAHVLPTASFVIDPDIDLEGAALRRAISAAVGEDRLSVLDATTIARRLAGDAIGANAFLLGFAFQKGLVPLTEASLMRAIELNGAAVALNKAAFAWGRVAVADPARVEAAMAGDDRATAREKTLDEAIDYRADYLTLYQNRAYANHYLASVRSVRAAEEAASSGSTILTGAVARSLFKLMAYKDEYEVARLHSDAGFAREIAETFEGDYRVNYNLAPPLFARRDPATGLPRKREFGPWMGKALAALARFKFLRGTALDPFGHTEHRERERRLLEDFETAMLESCRSLTADDLPELARRAALPQDVRGYGPIKDKSMNAFDSQWEAYLATKAPRDASPARSRELTESR